MPPPPPRGATDTAAAGSGSGGGFVRPPSTQPTRSFTPDQLRVLQIQVHVHVQMLVQTLILSRSAMKSEAHFAQIALLAYGMLVEICMHCDVTLAHKQLKARPLYATPLRLPTAGTGASASASSSAAASAQPPLPSSSAAASGGWLGVGGGDLSSDSAAALRVHSVFKVPGMHLLPDLLLSRCGLKRLYDAKDTVTRQRIAREVRHERFDARVELERFREFFNPHYLLAKEPGRQVGLKDGAFTAAEDRLFATGLRRYGLDRFDAIRAHLLPTKEPEVLRKRYDQQTARRAEANAIKRARIDFEPTKLSPLELHTLKNAVNIYGEGNWSMIRINSLPSRTERELEMSWNAHKAMERAPVQIPLPPVPPVIGALPPAVVPQLPQSSSTTTAQPATLPQAAASTNAQGKQPEYPRKPLRQVQQQPSPTDPPLANGAVPALPLPASVTAPQMGQTHLADSAMVALSDDDDDDDDEEEDEDDEEEEEAEEMEMAAEAQEEDPSAAAGSDAATHTIETDKELLQAWSVCRATQEEFDPQGVRDQLVADGLLDPSFTATMVENRLQELLALMQAEGVG